MDTATPIGFRDGSDDRQPVCIPLELRLQHTHVIGHSRTGKSTLMERMALHDIQEGHGVAVLDPCGSLVERLMRLVQPGHADRVIYFAPGDLNWIPLWNPLACTDRPDRSRVVDPHDLRVMSPTSGQNPNPKGNPHLRVRAVAIYGSTISACCACCACRARFYRQFGSSNESVGGIQGGGVGP